MPRRLLHFALVLSLILNGISAPWAMARMEHGDHGGKGEHAAHHGASQGSDADAIAHHGHHDRLDTGAAGDTGSLPDPLADGNCCDGSSCQCGCVLPPVLALRMTGVLPVSVGMPAFVAAESHPVLRRTSPPLRPPAV